MFVRATIINAGTNRVLMIDIDRRVWPILEIVGIIVLIIGTAGYTGFVAMGHGLSIVVFVAGLISILIGFFFIYMDGREVKAGMEDLMRVVNVRNSAKAVPNDSPRGYALDMTEAWNINVCPDDFDFEVAFEEDDYSDSVAYADMDDSPEADDDDD